MSDQANGWNRLECGQPGLNQQRALAESIGVGALLAAVDARDSYTGEHCRSVVRLSLAVSRSLGLSSRAVEQVGQVALLHDLGKIAVPAEVLHKRGPLNALERKIIERHSVTGARIVSAVPVLAHLAPAIRAIHERWDGRGYPDGLCGAQIPVASRIIFVCDAYEAMTADRPYRRALRALQAREEVRVNTGTQFCTRAAPATLRAIARLDEPSWHPPLARASGKPSRQPSADHGTCPEGPLVA